MDDVLVDLAGQMTPEIFALVLDARGYKEKVAQQAAEDDDRDVRMRRLIKEGCNPLVAFECVYGHSLAAVA